MDFIEYIDIKTIFTLLHIIGVVIAAGTALFSDILFLSSIKDGKINKLELSLLKKAGVMVWTGLFVAIPSGVGLFSLAADSYLLNSTFSAKMTIFMVLIVNGIIFHMYHLPSLETLVGKKIFTSQNKIKKNTQLVASGVVSATSWILVLILGSMVHIPFGYWVIMSVYLIMILIGLLVSPIIMRSFLDKRDLKTIKRNAIIVALILVVVSIFAGRFITSDKDIVSIDKNSTEEQLLESVQRFSLSEVAEHTSPDNCWLIIDGLVFDMSEASKLHPAQFPNCGGDATENYYKSHAPSRIIRDKQMKFHIGYLEGVDIPEISNITGPEILSECEAPDRPGDSTNPTTELFVDSKSWNPLDLMIIIEKHCRSLIFIDGTTHQVIGRISNIGHQMHAPTVSNDGKYMYIVARDGFVSKIDLNTLETLIQTRVGKDSRGTGLTDDGKYLLVGNFEPHTAVLLDTTSLKIIKEYKIETTLNGEKITSRVGGIAQKGSLLYVVIKDANQVWVIDTSKENFPVIAKYEDLGQKDGVTTPPLHDIYLTPDGDYLIAAVQDTSVVWVLNTKTGEVEAEVPTGETPHTGPGATVGNLTFIPTLDEKGVISVIDTSTWTNIMNISTGGPSLFIRHNPHTESVEEYPYVWGETAFGDRHDEIYIINLNWIKEGKENPIEYTLKPVPGESSWHPEFTYDGKFVYIVSMTGNQVVVYNSETFEVVTRIRSGTPSSVINVGNRTHEPGL